LIDRFLPIFHFISDVQWYEKLAPKSGARKWSPII